MTAKTLLVSLGTMLAAAALPAQAGLLSYQDVTFTSSWKGNVLTLEIDAAKHSGDWNNATGLKALALKGIGDYTKVSVTAAPNGASGWKMSSDELKAGGCSGDTNGQAGSRLCFYGAQMALTNDMVFSFTFEGLGVKPVDPHVKVNFVDARGGKVGSLLSQTLPASPAPAASTPVAAPAPTPAAPVVPVSAQPVTGGTAGSAGKPVPAASTTPVQETAPAPAPAQTQTSTPTQTQTPTPAPLPIAVETPAPTPPVQTVELPPALTPPTGLPLVVPAAATEQVVADAGRPEPTSTPTPTAEPAAAKPSADVPEPHGIALLLAGLGAMGIMLRRRGKAADKAAKA